MRGEVVRQEGLFSCVSPESRIPKGHPLRGIRTMVDKALAEMDILFRGVYSDVGRPGVPPEKLLRALLQVLYTVRSERLLVEQLDYNLLFRWFVGLSVDEPVWDHSTFSKNRDRLLSEDSAGFLLNSILEQAQGAGLLSDEHFSVDGTMIEAWASLKSFRPKDGDETPSSGGRNGSVDFRGEKRTNETHASATDPEARLMRKGDGREAKLCYAGVVLMDNREGLAVDARLEPATGTAEREAAAEMLEAIPGEDRLTVGGDKGFDTRGFVEKMRELRVTPHVAQNTSGRRSAIDGRTTRHGGYAASQKVRKRIEEIFGWLKTVGGLRKTRFRGREKVGWHFLFRLAAYNLVRMRNLGVASP